VGEAVPGLGVSVGRICLSFSLVNASVSVLGFPGIGSGSARAASEELTIENMSLTNSIVSANSSSTAIGSGGTESGGRSRVDRVTIWNSTVVAVGGGSSYDCYGSGIGSG
jgi:hypothetical protein